MKILFKVFLLGLIGVIFSGCFIVMPPDKETVMAQQLDVWCILRENKDKERYEESIRKAKSFLDKDKYGDRVQIAPRGEYSVSLLDRAFSGDNHPGLYWREYGLVYKPITCDRENKKLNMVVEITPHKVKAQNEKDGKNEDAYTFINFLKERMAQLLYSSKEIGELMELGSSLDLIFIDYETRKEIDKSTYDFAGYKAYNEK